MGKSQAVETLIRALLGTRMITHVHLKVARGRVGLEKPNRGVINPLAEIFVK